ncbi:hypothetical protein ANCCEY_07499 [Ancylostoma ceylanicum]|uniref:Uncharacterized protein n=1 Tax=Ancylostoma ceylanicum TaxID=53326 RepID=A0A0D6LQE8_9BILA|nr:hypothetical protein ANCCEY_07499 [Ancylostoma ceylanicum]
MEILLYGNDKGISPLYHTNPTIFLRKRGTVKAFRTGGLLTGILHLTALAVAHYLQIQRPFDHQKFLSLRTVQVVVFFIWAVPPLSLMIYFSSWPGQGYSPCKMLAKYLFVIAEFVTVVHGEALSMHWFVAKPNGNYFSFVDVVIFRTNLHKGSSRVLTCNHILYGLPVERIINCLHGALSSRLMKGLLFSRVNGTNKRLHLDEPTDQSPRDRESSRLMNTSIFVSSPILSAWVHLQE